MGYFEIAFDILYLISVTVISIIILLKGIKNNNKAFMVFGVMGILLGLGDSFHLVPRIFGHLNGFELYQTELGIGKLITSITMTIFYYLIYRYYVLKTKKANKTIHITLIGLIIIRFALLALPGNDWVNNGNALLYGVLRNIPFAIIGVIIVYLFLQVGKQEEYKLFKNMGIWIIVSFVCYIIVVVGSGSIAALGAFMMPKTVAYFIIVYLGYKDTKTLE